MDVSSCMGRLEVTSINNHKVRLTKHLVQEIVPPRNDFRPNLASDELLKITIVSVSTLIETASDKQNSKIAKQL